MELKDLIFDERDVTMSFGKYKGKKINEIPDGYLVWLYDNVNMDYMLREAVVSSMVERFKGIVKEGEPDEGKYIIECPEYVYPY